MNSKFSTFISSFNPQTKGKQFEVFVKWFLENDPVWKSEVDKVAAAIELGIKTNWEF